MRTKRVYLPVVLALATLFLTANVTLAYDWPQFNYDVQHSGSDTAETLITVSNVGHLQQLFRVQLPAIAAGAPVYLSSSASPVGGRSMLYLTTQDGRILALDAHSGSQIWAQQPARGPQFTTSSPALDPNGQYIYSYGLDGYINKYVATSGAEIIDASWPQTITLKPDVEKVSSALSTAIAADGASYLYATTAGYPLPEPGDAGDYQGHLTAINLGSGAQHVFNSLCSDLTVHFVESGTIGFDDCEQTHSGIWARPGAVFDSDTNRIYIATGNGDYSGNAGGYDWGDSILALNPDGSAVNGLPLDSYTPSNYVDLQEQDLDVGSSNLAPIPPPTGSIYPHLGVQAGKEGVIYLINLDDMSGQGGSGHTGGELQRIAVPLAWGVLASPTVWVNPADGSSWVFYVNNLGISALQLAIYGGMPALVPRWFDTGGGSSPIVANGVLYYASSGEVYALDPTNGSLVWQDNTIGNIHWQSPIVADGVLYITDERAQLTAYTLFPTTPTPTVTGTPPTATPTRTPLNTPALPTATSTLTPAPPTATPTASLTPAPPTTTPTATTSPTPPSATPTATTTPVPSSATPTTTTTPVPSSATPSPTPPICVDPFVDLQDNPFRPAIHSLYCRGVVAGVDSSHYQPTAASTRSEFAKIAVEGFGLPISTPPAGATFSDVMPGYYAYTYIESAYAAGILSGFDTASCAAAGAAYPCYLPNRPITRAQLTKLSVTAARYPLYTPGSGQTFSDVPPQSAFFVFVETAYQQGLINGYPDHSFRPNNSIRRDEMAQIVYTALTNPRLPYTHLVQMGS